MKKIPKPKPAKGRPKLGHESHTLSAHPDQWAKLANYGDGNLSAGLQRLIHSLPWPNDKDFTWVEKNEETNKG